MIIFRYICYRMYKAYDEKEDSPILRTFIYISLLVFFIIGSFFIHLEKLISFCHIILPFDLSSVMNSPVFWLALIFLDFFLTYLFFFRKSINDYEKRFLTYHVLNKYVKIWMLIILPFLILFVSIYLYVYLFGGTVLGKEITGVLHT